MARWDEYLQASRDVLDATRHSLDATRIDRAVTACVTALAADKPLLICGNGGSAADAMHIAGELVGRFLKERRGLKAIALTADSAILTAWGNDYSYETIFSRQVEAYGEAGGVLLGLSTSGNSANVVAAVNAARRRGMTSIALTGKGGGKLAPLVDILLDVPAIHTPLIQQAHICVYHFLCEEIEARIAG
jgi:D-sedoheptulose 7-phosphate isomerase